MFQKFDVVVGVVGGLAVSTVCNLNRGALSLVWVDNKRSYNEICKSFSLFETF